MVIRGAEADEGDLGGEKRHERLERCSPPRASARAVSAGNTADGATDSAGAEILEVAGQAVFGRRLNDKEGKSR